MAKGMFRCSRCDRTFSMKAHLARHMNTIHGSSKRVQAVAAKKRVKRAGKKKVGRPRGRVVAVRRAPTDGGMRVLSEMRAYHAELTTMRGSLDSQINAIESAMSAMGGLQAKAAPRRGRPPGRTTRRAGRAGSLKESIVNVLRTQRTAMSPRELSSAVVRAGYKTKAKDLTKAISNILPQLKMIKKVGRGMYQA